MEDGQGRPEVTVVDPRTGARPVVEPVPPPTRRRRLGWLAGGAVLVLLAVGLLVRQTRPQEYVDPPRVTADGTVAVTLVLHRAARVPVVRLQDDALAVTAPGALPDEVTAAQERGGPPSHDPQRLLPAGSHTFVLGVRLRCPPQPAPPRAAVLLDVARQGTSRTLAAPLRPRDLAVLRCDPLALRAGLSPVAPAPGRVQLLVTAHSGARPGGADLQSLAWAGYRVAPVGAVVPLVLSRAGIDETVFFDVVLTPDCGTRPAGGLVARFADQQLPVPLDPVATARVAALRAAGCR